MSDDKKKDQDKLRFDTKRHDEKVEKRKTDEFEAIQKKNIAIIGDKWKLFKIRLKSKARTSQDVIKMLHKFMADIDPLLWQAPENFRNTTIELFEDKIAQIVATSCGRVGSIHQFLPEGIDKTPETVPFNSREELEAIPWVKAFMEKPDFIGFCTDRNRLVAVYEAGKTNTNDLPIVGSMIVPKKIRKQFKYPLLAEFGKMLGEKIAESN